MCYNCVLRKRKNIGLSLSEKERARIRFRVQNRPVFTPEFCVLISSAVSAHQLSRDDRNVIFQTADWSVRLILCSDWLMFEKVLAGWSVSWEKALPWHWGSDGEMVTQDQNWISAIKIKVLVKNNQAEIGGTCYLHIISICFDVWFSKILVQDEEWDLFLTCDMLTFNEWMILPVP